MLTSPRADTGHGLVCPRNRVSPRVTKAITWRYLLANGDVSTTRDAALGDPVTETTVNHSPARLRDRATVPFLSDSLVYIVYRLQLESQDNSLFHRRAEDVSITRRYTTVSSSITHVLILSLTAC